MKYLSTQLLNDLSQLNEKTLAKVASEWKIMPQSSLSARPGSEQWSAAECIEHLNSYGRYYLPAIEKAIAAAGKSKASLYFKSSWLGNYFYKTMLPDQNGLPKKRMVSPKDHKPATSLNASEVVDEFIGQLEWLERLLMHARGIDLNKARVPISIAPFIKLKLGDVFLFFIAHIDRHLRQAERATEKAWITQTSSAGLPLDIY